ncbi:MAG TPA: class I SAM-dependent methyltransferase [Candidatus Obscuribacterales bacterium]
MSLFSQVFASLPRQGPGSAACTLRGLDSLRPYLPPAARVLDIGCGSGSQTLTLAQALPEARLTAVDLSEQLLSLLQVQARTQGLDARIDVQQADMGQLPFDPGSFDLIWSEGALYILGLEAGLSQWQPLLKPGGCLGFTHIAWLTDRPAAAAKKFWAREYPAISNQPQILATLAALGLSLRAEFILPAQAWWQDYYAPLEAALQALPQTPEAEALAAACREEIALYRDHGQDYGYVFYGAQN